MQDTTQTNIDTGRAPLLSRDNLKRATAVAAPVARYVPKNPLFLLGAVAVGVAGVLAWRNRERIAERAGPMLDDAKARAQPLLDNAAARGEALREKLPFRRRGEAEVSDFDPAVH